MDFNATTEIMGVRNNMIRASKQTQPARPPAEIRQLILDYFYARNKNSKSLMGKKGAAVKISDTKSELKAIHGLSQQEVQANLNYLISQGWIEERIVQKQITAKGGTIIPSSTTFYQISAAGIDKIEGPGEFTMKKFHDIKIEATGQNIITLGDGNQIEAKFQHIGDALTELRKAIAGSDADENEKLSYVADIETIQSQLVKTAPNRTIIKAAWESVKAAAAINGCSNLVADVGVMIGLLVSGA